MYAPFWDILFYYLEQSDSNYPINLLTKNNFMKIVNCKNVDKEQ